MNKSEGRNILTQSSVKLSRMAENYKVIYDELLCFSNTLTRLVNTNTYYIVFQPYNQKYEQYEYEIINRGMDNIGQWLRKRCHSFAYILTRETIATKVHYNAIVFSTSTYLVDNFHNSTVARKYQAHVQLAYNIPKLLEYMLKEALERDFSRLTDYDFKKYSLAKQFIKETVLDPIIVPVRDQGVEVDSHTSVARVNRDPGTPSSECNDEDIFIIDLLN